MSDHFSSHQQPSVHRIVIDVVRGIAIGLVPVRLSRTPGVMFGDTFYATVPPNPNLCIKTLKRGGAKVYFRFHGGMGGGIASWNTITNHSPLKLFIAFKPIDFQLLQNGMLKMIMERVPVIGPPAPPVQASSGSTGVMYLKRELRFGTFDHVYKNGD